MPKITNISAFNLRDYTPNENTVLIRIGDFRDPFFPKVRGGFSEIYTFCFDDTDTDGYGSITGRQADEIASILKKCLVENKDILVHCVAGLCRSGAVAECGIVIGFSDGGNYRQPNILVKNKLFNALGLRGYADMDEEISNDHLF